jgi:hypothetical protein
MAEPIANLPAAGNDVFPAALAAVPDGEQAPESFGWSPVVWGAALLVTAAAWLRFPDSRGWNAMSLAILGVLIASGALLVFYEVRRRQTRTVLVSREGRLGVYRAGALAAAITPSQVTRYYLSHMNTFRYLLLPAMGTVGGIAVAISPQVIQRGESLGFVLGSAGLATFLASLVRTRILLHHYLLPKGKRRETVMLDRASSSRLFPPPDRT